jgi:catechol 2,3-dioxygenase-like lactoylglutathione lyase family enzyme
MPRVRGVLETTLYVEEIEPAARFYEDLFGFKRLDSDDRFCAFSVADRQVLLLFKHGATTHPIAFPGGMVPPHDGSGHLHFAFSIAASELQRWESHLEAKGIAIESRVRWPRGGSSIYFRDPDHHLVELVTPGCWPIY